MGASFPSSKPFAVSLPALIGFCGFVLPQFSVCSSILSLITKRELLLSIEGFFRSSKTGSILSNIPPTRPFLYSFLLDVWLFG